MTDRPNMTRDAKLITARKLEEANDERLAALARDGAHIEPLGWLVMRFESVIVTLFDGDQRATLELDYQQRVSDQLDAVEAQAAEAIRRAKLHVPGDHPAGAGRPRPGSLQDKRRTI